MLYCYPWVWLANIEKLAKAIYPNVLNVKLVVAELLSITRETEPKVDTITVDAVETPSNLQLFLDASTQASTSKVTVQVKGKDKGSLCIKCL